MAEIEIENVAKRSIRGVVALVYRTFTIQIIGLVANFLLTVFLSPSIFGIFFVVSAAIAFLSYFSDIGLAAALIQKKEAITDEELRTTFTIQQILVVSVVLLALGLSGFVKSFYRLDDQGILLFQALVVSFFLSSLKTIPSIILERNLRFEKLVIPQIVENLFFYIIAVVLAAKGFGVASFTFAVLARGISGVITIYIINPWRMRFGFQKSAAKKLLSFGLPFQTNSVLALIKDDLLIVYLGRVLPLAQVGYIGFAQKWAFTPLRLIMDNVIRVTFPSFSRLQNDKEVLTKAIEKSIFAACFLIFPAMMVTPFLLLYILFLAIASYRKKQKKTIIYLLSGTIFGIAISCFYWLPALAEMKYTNVLSQIGGGANFLDHYVCLFQLWSSPWGYGGSAVGCVDGLSFMIGKLHVLVSITSVVGVSLLVMLKKHRQDTEKVLITGFSFLGFILSIFLTLEISKFIWQAMPLMAFFQYPWRFLLMVSFFSSLLAGSFIWLITFLPIKRFFPHFVFEISALLIFALLFLNVKFFVPQKLLQVNSNYYTNEYSLKWTTSKISDEYLPKDTKKPKNAKEALLNKQIFIFKETPIEKTADLISISGIVTLFIGIILPGKKHYGK